ncbi:MAG: protease I [Enterobacterales bacterium]|jgi:protease I
MKSILIPLPTYGFDPTEVAIPWKLLTEKNIEVVFITPNGRKASADSVMLTGDQLGLFSNSLRARNDATEAYYAMIKSAAFCRPASYNDIYENDYDGILLPGGHDKSVKEYLESRLLQKLIVEFFNAKKSVAAVCHGVVLVARSIDPETNKSVIYDFKTTALLKSQELLAYNLTRFWLKNYYLTYPGLTVEDEVTSALCDKKNFVKGSLPLLRDDENHLKRGFVCVDRNYISARWPGDIYQFTLKLIDSLDKY